MLRVPVYDYVWDPMPKRLCPVLLSPDSHVSDGLSEVVQGLGRAVVQSLMNIQVLCNRCAIY